MGRYVRLILSIAGLISAVPMRATANQDLVPVASAENVEDCHDLLRPGSPTVASIAAVRELSARLDSRGDEGPSALIEQLRRITNQLVEENRITRAQADTVFADRVLGDFSDIFLKYAIAELRDRNFDDQQVAAFVLYFADAYDSDTKVDFALAVARRILVTVSDGTSLRSGRGIDQFTAVCRELGVDPKSWARFGNVWEAVRTAHLSTIVQFILTNLYRTGDRLNAEVDRQIGERSSTTDRAGKWMSWWPRDEPPGPTREQLALRRLGAVRVPSFMTDIDCLKLERDPPRDTMSRACLAEPSFDLPSFLDRLEITPAFGREYLIGEQLSHMNLAQLETIGRWHGYARLSESLRQRLEVERRRLGEVRSLSEAIGAALLESRRPRSVDFPRFKTFEQTVQWLATDLLDQRSRWGRRVAEQTPVVLAADYLRFREAYPRLTGRDFIRLAREVIAYTFATSDGAFAVAVTKVLMVISREFALEESEIHDLFGLMRTYDLDEPGFFDRRPIQDFENVEVIMNPKNWGGVDTEDKGNLDKLPDLVAKLRASLPPNESDKIIDDDFYPGIASSQQRW